jgi:2OG-Fe(II) oxygenase superfamily
MFDDLHQVLGYRGAVDERDGWEQVAPDLLVTPFWTPSFCATVIRAAEAVGAFEPDDEDPVPGHEVSLAVISPRLGAVEQHIGSQIWPRLREVWPYIDYHGLRDVFVIRYAPGEQESLRIHHDVAQVSASVKLNADHEGAELTFPRQGFSNIDVPVGELLVWPSLVTHPHRTEQLRRGVKYALTVWCELPTFA